MTEKWKRIAQLKLEDEHEFFRLGMSRIGIPCSFPEEDTKNNLEHLKKRINWVQLEKDVQNEKYRWMPSFWDTLRCLLEAFEKVASPTDKGKIFQPIRPLAKKQGVDAVDDFWLILTGFFDISTTVPFAVVKTRRPNMENNTKMNDRLLHEYILGRQVVQIVQGFSPHFASVLTFFGCPSTFDEQKNALCLPTTRATKEREEGEGNLTYAFIQGISPYSVVEGCSRVNIQTIEHLLCMSVQLCMAIVTGHCLTRFNHGDLHFGNVLVHTLDQPIEVRYNFFGRIFYLKTSLMSTIIDYGLASGNFDGQSFDLFQVLGSSESSVNHTLGQLLKHTWFLFADAFNSHQGRNVYTFLKENTREWKSDEKGAIEGEEVENIQLANFFIQLSQEAGLLSNSSNGNLFLLDVRQAPSRDFWFDRWNLAKFEETLEKEEKKTSKRFQPSLEEQATVDIFALLKSYSPDLFCFSSNKGCLPPKSRVQSEPLTRLLLSQKTQTTLEEEAQKRHGQGKWIQFLEPLVSDVFQLSIIDCPKALTSTTFFCQFLLKSLGKLQLLRLFAKESGPWQHTFCALRSLYFFENLQLLDVVGPITTEENNVWFAYLPHSLLRLSIKGTLKRANATEIELLSKACPQLDFLSLDTFLSSFEVFQNPECFPHLKHLHLDIFFIDDEVKRGGSPFLNVFVEHRKELSSLVLENSSKNCQIKMTARDWYRLLVAQEKWETLLLIKFPPFDFPPDALPKFLSKHLETLRHFQVNAKENTTWSASWFLPLLAKFNEEKKLPMVGIRTQESLLEGGGGEMDIPIKQNEAANAEVLQMFIQMTPHLEICPPLDASLFTPLTLKRIGEGWPKLRHISLIGIQKIVEQDLIGFLRHSNRGLESIWIDSRFSNNPRLSPKLFQALLEKKSLRICGLLTPLPMWSLQDVLAFLQKHQSVRESKEASSFVIILNGQTTPTDLLNFKEVLQQRAPSPVLVNSMQTNDQKASVLFFKSF
jgi:hypothetical protein